MGICALLNISFYGKERVLSSTTIKHFGLIRPGHLRSCDLTLKEGVLRGKEVLYYDGKRQKLQSLLRGRGGA